ncbi:MAG: magnesium and cobalt transport protein CorA, partial [Bacteroidales bacterium]|nr:magnesium and cobalt transport protein CorA [Bacteroidales bacterium]
MSEVRLFYYEDNRIKIAKSLDALDWIDTKDIIWIDLNNVAFEVESRLEQFLKIDI